MHLCMALHTYKSTVLIDNIFSPIRFYNNSKMNKSFTLDSKYILAKYVSGQVNCLIHAQDV